MTNLDTTLKLAIETYAELSGMTFGDVANECLKEGHIKNSVIMLMVMAG